MINGQEGKDGEEEVGRLMIHGIGTSLTRKS